MTDPNFLKDAVTEESHARGRHAAVTAVRGFVDVLGHQPTIEPKRTTPETFDRAAYEDGYRSEFAKIVDELENRLDLRRRNSEDALTILNDALARNGGSS